MATKTPRPRSKADKSTADFRRRLESAARDRARRLIEIVSPDRTCARPPLLVLSLPQKRSPYRCPAGYPFSVAGQSGTIELLTTREELISSARIETSERVQRVRVSTDRGEYSGVRLELSGLAQAHPLSLRVFVGDLDTLGLILTYGEIYERSRSGDARPCRLSPSGIEHGVELYPTPRLGCHGRSLLGTYLHAPFALAFLDVELPSLAEETAELLVLFRNPAIADRIDPSAFHLGCLPARNERAVTVCVTAEPTGVFAPIPVPSGETVARIGRVQYFCGNGQWEDCRPWLGTRYAWKERREDYRPQYVLSGLTGDRRPAIGVVEPGRGLDARATHLNVELILADEAASRIAVGTTATGDRGEQAITVARGSPLLVPLDIEPLELDAEARASGWLSRGACGDVTDGLCSLLERAGGGVGPSSGRIPAPTVFESCVKRMTTRIAPSEGCFPLLDIELELDRDKVERHTGHIFAAVLERSLPFFAPPHTGTRLTLLTPEGSRQWQPRWPAS